MGLFQLLFFLIAVGVVVWLATTYIPMDQKIKTLIVVVALIVCGMVALRALGVLDFDVPAKQFGTNK